jgi:membrane associated rhomboid family serine protease
MAYSYKRMNEAFDHNNAVLRLVVVCLALFATMGVLWGIWLFSYPKQEVYAVYRHQILDWVTVPASFQQFITKPWTIITYAFADPNFLSVFPNLFWLWCFGYILQDVGENKMVIPLFIHGIIVGALFYLLFNAISPITITNTTGYLVGAGPGVMAVVIATAIRTPEYRLFPLLGGGMPVWVLALIYGVATVLLFGLDNMDMLMAQAGGLVAGVVFIMAYKNGVDMGKWVNNFLDWVNNLFNPDRPKKGKELKAQLFYKATHPPFIKYEKPTEERIDAILDKISSKGYSSLSEVEKELLERASEADV